MHCSILASCVAAKMQWTPGLHSLFIQAVNQLGGPAEATPSGILKLMGVEELTRAHVHSHLQTYRRKLGADCVPYCQA